VGEIAKASTWMPGSLPYNLW